MSPIRTVRGDIEPTDLGVTYMHEHLIIDSAYVSDELPHIHLPSVDDAVAELAPCVTAGLGGLVDAMPMASGRDVVRLAETSRRSGVHILAATGLHTPKYYGAAPWTETASEDVLADLFTADIVEGIDRYDNVGPTVDRTGHRAGIVKVATMGGGPTDRDRRLFAAAVESQRRTGAAILTHCEEGRGAVEQIELLTSLGAAPDRVVMSHTDKVTDPAYHRDLLASGVNLEYDQALRQDLDEPRGTAWLLTEMLAAGFADQLMLGTDGARRSLWTSLGGAPGLAWLLTGFTEVLDRRGVDAKVRNALFVDNPARVLTLAE